jgi:periplasmic divalent cation tolerance protein
MFIAWTTVARREEADRLAADVIARQLATCVQIDGPITSHFRWAGQDQRSEEFRLTFKFLPAQLEALQAHVLSAHPYETPEWLVVPAVRVGEKYLSWAEGDSSNRPL